MKVNDRSVAGFARTLYRRALACILLTPIVYAATIGAAHNHVNTRVEPTGGFSASVEGGPVLNTPLQNHSSSNECLICVFHKQLFNTTIPEGLFVAKAQVHIGSAATWTIFSYSGRITSEPVARLSGRAPPTA